MTQSFKRKLLIKVNFRLPATCKIIFVQTEVVYAEIWYFIQKMKKGQLFSKCSLYIPPKFYLYVLNKPIY